VLAFRPSPGIAGDDPLIYLSYQTASIASNFNTVSLLQAPTKISGSELKAYELGFKTHFFEVMNFDTAFFYYKQKNPYTQVVSLQSGGAVHFENAQGIETKGWEASLVTPLLPSIDDGLVLTFGTCYLDSTYSSYKNASGFNETTGVYSNNYDATGNRVVQTPKWTVSAGLNQTIDFDNSSIDFGIDYYYNDGYFFLAQNSSKSEVPSYETIGVTASYKYNPWALRISVFGRNLTNEKYLNGRFVNDFGVIDYAAYKSTAGVNVQWDF
jgi:iron complex outermembrane receptor protein